MFWGQRVCLGGLSCWSWRLRVCSGPVYVLLRKLRGLFFVGFVEFHEPTTLCLQWCSICPFRAGHLEFLTKAVAGAYHRFDFRLYCCNALSRGAVACAPTWPDYDELF